MGSQILWNKENFVWASKQRVSLSGIVEKVREVAALLLLPSFFNGPDP